MASREESEYDSGIKRRLYDYSSYDSLTGSLCGRQLRRGREREENEKERTRTRGRGGGRQSAAGTPVLLPEASPSARTFFSPS